MDKCFCWLSDVGKLRLYIHLGIGWEIRLGMMPLSLKVFLELH